MHKKIATVIIVVMLAALAGLVLAANLAPGSAGSVKAVFTETR